MENIPESKGFGIETFKRTLKCNIDIVTWARSFGTFTKVNYDVAGERNVSCNIGEIEKPFKDKSYWRCDQSFLINIRFIFKIDLVLECAIMKDGTRINISRKNVKLVKSGEFQKKFKLEFQMLYVYDEKENKTFIYLHFRRDVSKYKKKN